jgi:hypothetical protein
MISWVKMLTETRPKNHSIVVLSLLLLNFQVRNDPETFSNMTSMPYTKNSMNKWIPHKKKTRWKIFFLPLFQFHPTDDITSLQVYGNEFKYP